MLSLSTNELKVRLLLRNMQRKKFAKFLIGCFFIMSNQGAKLNLTEILDILL